MSTDPATTPALSAPLPVNLGAVFTKRWVVDLILDLAGYDPALDLAATRVVEPSVGHGAFLTAIAERVAESCRRHGRPISDAIDSVVGFDIDPVAVQASRRGVIDTLVASGVDLSTSEVLATAWVKCGDFLEVALDGLGPVEWVVGNPPYVRIEDVDRTTMDSYRSSWKTMSGRADLYVGFIEAALAICAPEGRVAFICADRWMRNKYGAGLRSLIEERYAVDACVVVHDVEAFEDSVAAYPAITVLRAGVQGTALVCDAGTEFGATAGERLLEIWRRGPAPVGHVDAFDVSWMPHWFSGESSWPAGSLESLALIADLEKRFPALEDVGVQIAVGVATGSDRTYVRDDVSGIEPDRVLPAVAAREVSSGEISWAGRFLVNPWGPDGKPIALAEYPGFKKFAHKHRIALKDRFVARSHPDVWWRTIDRVDAAVASTPKLLIPDLKDRIHPVLDEGVYYPLHSLYYLTSDSWDLEVLGGLLMSDVANTFVEAYSVRMASGYLRVSAQYLRRVRVPRYESISDEIRTALRAAFRARDRALANSAATVAYGLGAT